MIIHNVKTTRPVLSLGSVQPVQDDGGFTYKLPLDTIIDNIDDFLAAGVLATTASLLYVLPQKDQVDEYHFHSNMTEWEHIDATKTYFAALALGAKLKPFLRPSTIRTILNRDCFIHTFKIIPEELRASYFSTMVNMLFTRKGATTAYLSQALLMAYAETYGMFPEIMNSPRFNHTQCIYVDIDSLKYLPPMDATVLDENSSFTAFEMSDDTLTHFKLMNWKPIRNKFYHDKDFSDRIRFSFGALWAPPEHRA